MHADYENREDLLRDEFLQVQLEIQEHGLDMIRKEVYESIGQVLSLVKLNLSDNSLENRNLHKKLAASRKLVGKAIRDLRSMAKPVTTREVSEKGVLYALQHELEIQERIGNGKISLEVGTVIHRFDPVKEMFVFRMLQELIQGFFKHAPGKPVIVQADCQEKKLVFTVRHGVPPGMSLPEKNGGIQFIDPIQVRTRTGLINAGFTTFRYPGGELTIVITIPLTA